jgi:hypothetical protein
VFRCSVRYASDEVTNRGANDGHVYFLCVLQRCSEIFEGNLKVLSTARPATVKASNARGSSSNLPQPIAKYRDLKRNPDVNSAYGKATHKTCELEPFAITKILRDYVLGRETSLRTWYRMNEGMSKMSGTSSRMQENGDLNILSFVKKPRDSGQLRHLLTRLEFDHIGLTLQCNEICQKIDVAQEILLGQPAKDEAHWKSPTDCGCSIVSTVLGDMDRFYQLKNQGGKKMRYVQDNNPVVLGAIKVVQRFLDGLKGLKV